MKKMTLFFVALMCSMSIFSTRYLVELGDGTSGAWRTAEAEEVNVNLTTLSVTLDVWHNNATLEFAQDDEIWLAAGTYVLSAPINLKRTTDNAANKSYAFYGGFAGTETSLDDRVVGTNVWDFTNETILDGNNSIQLVTSPDLNNGGYYDADNGKYWIFNGLTFTKGSGANGGAVACNGASKFINSKFTNNAATGQGGGLYGTGQFIVIDGCLFSENKSGANGAGASVTGDRMDAWNSTFEFNEMTPEKGLSSGGGLYIQTNQGWGTVKNSIFRGNFAAGYGGGLAVAGAAMGNIENCLIVNNKSLQEYGSMSALHFNGGKIVNTTIANNEGGIRFDKADGEMINTIIYNNDSGNGATGKTYDNPQATTMTNCALDITNASFTETSPVVLTTTPFASPTSFVGLPTDDSEKTALLAANWQLQSASSCVDAGTDTGAPATDIEGTARPQGAGIDIGAYEYGTNNATGKITMVDFTINMINNGIEISGLQAMTAIAVYNMAGALVKQVVAEGSASIELEKGIYLVAVGENIGKIIVQ